MLNHINRIFHFSAVGKEAPEGSFLLVSTRGLGEKETIVERGFWDLVGPLLHIVCYETRETILNTLVLFI